MRWRWKRGMAKTSRTVSFLRGFRAPFEGISFLWGNRGLWKYVWIPFLINVLLFFGLGLVFVALFPDLIQFLLPVGDVWYLTLLRALLWAVGSMVLGIIFLLVFTVVGNLIAGPFNDALSERVEGLMGGHAPPSRGLAHQFGELGRTALEEAKRILFFLSGSLVFLLWNLIPGVGQILYAVTTSVWTLLFLALEFGDYYLVRHWIRFRARWSHIWAHRWASLGFGAGASVLLMIPLINLLLIPCAVTGGTLLWLRLVPSQNESRR